MRGGARPGSGRPKGPILYKVQYYILPEQDEQVRLMAKDAGQGISEYVRELIEYKWEMAYLKPKRKRFTGEQKVRILSEVARCQTSERIARILKREKITSSHIAKWKKLFDY